MANMSFASEKDMQEVFVEWLIGNHSPSKILQYFRIGDYGIADIITINMEFKIDIWELKNRPFEIKDLLQILRYHKGLCSIYEKSFDKIFSFQTIQIGLNFVCTDFEISNDYIYLPDVFEECVDFYKSEIKLSGVDFIPISGYYLKNQKTLDPEKEPCPFLEDYQKHIELSKKQHEEWQKKQQDQNRNMSQNNLDLNVNNN